MLVRDVITEKQQLNEVAPLVALGYVVTIGLGIWAASDAIRNVYRLTKEFANEEITFEQLVRMGGRELALAIRDFVLAYGAVRVAGLTFQGFKRLWNMARRQSNAPVTGRDAARTARDLGAAGAGAAAADAASDAFYP